MSKRTRGSSNGRRRRDPGAGLRGAAEERAIGKWESIRDDRDAWRAARSTAPVRLETGLPSAAGRMTAATPVVNGARPSTLRVDAGAARSPTRPRDAAPDRSAPDAGSAIPVDAGAALPEAAPLASADAGSTAVPVACGTVWCPPGQSCCNASCGICMPPGVGCTGRDCRLFSYQASAVCGMTTCNVGYVCCNWSCGTCALPGQSCDEHQCNDSLSFPTSEMCGMTTCNVGYECCNPSCGTCALPGEPCSREPCG